ncbi:hypothetical protein H109_00158 [Trichophyton interdigitale MR816]|uniref:Chromatin modification-related protein EAF6 n=1 Tax=Trichophyton interdigitale (strain MR816) TaxID=1215338 RepID=A0A059JJZ7_TRIIM|nr:hypothetical protein H101_05723 [Trichophyton interdigitale H6]KDB28013.1 hypothetical protein H109_00158 [Trichophyton interdigitale MR816]
MASEAPAAPASATTASAANESTAAAAPAASGAADQQAPARGIPYYEKLRRELRDTLQKKRLMDKNLAALEESIYRFEQSYLEETGAGNIIKGFDNYIKGASSLSSMGGGGIGGSFGSGNGPTTRRKGQVADSDRVFSRSSTSFMRDSPAPSSAHTTPSHAQTPTSTAPGIKSEGKEGSAAAAGGNKTAANKKSNRKSVGDASSVRRDRETGDEGDSKQPLKRLKITYVRGE